MQTIGAFSVSLTVKDIQKSYDFYTKLGFEPIEGKLEDKWIIVKNKDCVIGLFEGMFDKNILTFNPGWNKDAQALEDFTDIRDIQKCLEQKGIILIDRVDETTSGPGSLMIEDPDGNPILLDQHV